MLDNNSSKSLICSISWLGFSRGPALFKNGKTWSLKDEKLIFPIRDRTGETSPPLPCVECHALFPMKITAWNGRLCGCRPTCDAESAQGAVCCPNCGNTFQISYSDEGWVADYRQWFGGSDDCQWQIVVWGDEPDEFGLDLDPWEDKPITNNNRWLYEIESQLDAGHYVFSSPKGPVE